tara:strand:+ start:130 stop:651 length:522 start_codon:yes stop_codon:yes gene_type:complete
MKSKEIKFNGVSVTCHRDGSIEWFNRKYQKNKRTFGFNTNGYRGVKINWKQTYVHRVLAIAFLGAADCDSQVDHINGDKGDNRIENLRMVTASQNNKAFQKKRKGCSSRYRGVHLERKTGRWVASINPKQGRMHVGTFGTEDEAAAAYDRVATRIGFLPECLNFKQPSMASRK